MPTYWFETATDGYREFTDKREAIQAAYIACHRDRERLMVYNDQGQAVYVAGRDLPGHGEPKR